MDEFFHWDPDAMSSDETTKIEPSLIATDAPSITSEPAATETKAESEIAKAESESKFEGPLIEAAAIELPKLEPIAEIRSETKPEVEASKMWAFEAFAPKPAAPEVEAPKSEPLKSEPAAAAAASAAPEAPEPQMPTL